jgi:hypothetical protein
MLTFPKFRAVEKLARNIFSFILVEWREYHYFWTSIFKGRRQKINEEKSIEEMAVTAVCRHYYIWYYPIGLSVSINNRENLFAIFISVYCPDNFSVQQYFLVFD